jgi:hypothetical protein
VPMIERRDQPNRARLQHPVAEHITGHVADADDRDRVVLGVDTEFREVPARGQPGAASGDAHRFVVIASGAARCEGVAQPEIVFGSNRIREIGETCRALVGRHHQVRVGVVVADRVGGAHGYAVDEIVGDVQQAADERGVAVGRRDAVAEHERTLCSGRDDRRVLHGLGGHQAEHLGAVALGTVGPAQSATRNGARPYVDSLDPVSPDKDLAVRNGAAGMCQAGRVELERRVALAAAVRSALVPIGAQHRAHEAGQRAQDAILVERGSVFE